MRHLVIAFSAAFWGGGGEIDYLLVAMLQMAQRRVVFETRSLSFACRQRSMHVVEHHLIEFS